MSAVAAETLLAFDIGAVWDEISLKASRMQAESNAAAPAARDVDCKTLLSDVLRADCSAFKAIGLGEDLRLAGSGIKGAALAVEGRLVHLYAFREEAQAGNGTVSRMVRASRRRGLH